MKNKVIIETLPIAIAELHRNSFAWNLKFSMAEHDLDMAKEWIKNKIECDIPVDFKCNIRLTISININSGKINIDYSGINCEKTKRLLKTYIDAYADRFVDEWAKIFSNN